MNEIIDLTQPNPSWQKSESYGRDEDEKREPKRPRSEPTSDAEIEQRTTKRRKNKKLTPGSADSEREFDETSHEIEQPLVRRKNFAPASLSTTTKPTKTVVSIVFDSKSASKNGMLELVSAYGVPYKVISSRPNGLPDGIFTWDGCSINEDENGKEENNKEHIVIRIISSEDLQSIDGAKRIEESIKGLIESSKRNIITVIFEGFLNHIRTLRRTGGQADIVRCYVNRMIGKLQVTSKISVLFCSDEKTTATFLLKMTSSIQQNEKRKGKTPNTLGFCVEASRPSSRGHSNLSGTWISALSQIPRISETMATSIANLFPTPHSIFQLISNSSSNYTEAEKILAEIQVKYPQTKRPIGQSAAHKIIHAFCGDPKSLIFQ